MKNILRIAHKIKMNKKLTKKFQNLLKKQKMSKLIAKSNKIYLNNNHKKIILIKLTRLYNKTKTNLKKKMNKINKKLKKKSNNRYKKMILNSI